VAAALERRTFRSAFAASATREWAFLRRSPWDLALATWLPCLCLALLAWLLSGGVARALPIAVVDDDHSTFSRALTRALRAAPAVRVTAQPAALGDAWALARALDVYAVVYIPSEASRDIARGASATVFAYYNASYRSAGQAAVGDIASVVQAFDIQIAMVDVARMRGGGRRSGRLSPVVAQTTMLFNPMRSYEYFLLSLIFPAVLHFALTLSVVGALGRELRDSSVCAWLSASHGALLPAVAGKLLPYLVLFLAQGIASLAWLSSIPANGVAGSVTLLIAAQALMYMAYAAIALLFVGLTRNMATALSLAAVYAGTSLAFSGAGFPVQETSTFVRVYNLLLPYTSYLKLQVQQLSMGAPWSASLVHVAALVGFVVVPGAIGLRLYSRAARGPSAWGQE